MAKNQLIIKGARQHNLKNIDVSIPLGTFTCVTGVSGSGKSSLVNEILYKKLGVELNRMKAHPGKHKKITGMEYLDKVVGIDQSPIGRTPRSNPPPIPICSTKSGISLPPLRRPRPGATGRGDSPLTPRGAGARPAAATVC